LFNIVFEFVDGRGLGAETEEKREPAATSILPWWIV
jgi:hypothetical protein